MKNLITLLIIAFSFQFTNAQEFIETEKYTITGITKTKQQEYTSSLFNVVLAEDNSVKIATLSIQDIDFLEDIDVSVLANPNLDNIEEVIKVDVNYNTCCTHTETYYFMVTDENDFISLPHIENAYCEDTVSEVKYIFPAQTLGKENTILKTAVNFTESFTIQDILILQSFVLNDDNFDNYDVDIVIN